MTAIVCNDAGGAEIISSFVRRTPSAYQFALEGPARLVFERKLGPIETIRREVAIAQADRVICGTGWQSDFEWEAIGLARKKNVPCTAFLDHWTNFAMRFERRGVRHLPDELWVGDEYARDIAHATFPSILIAVVDNPYLLDVKDELTRQQINTPPIAGSVLYVCEPVRFHANLDPAAADTHGYSEFDALRFFLASAARWIPAPARIRIRPHPSETVTKYLWAAAEFPALAIEYSDGSPLVREIAEAGIIAGCESMAMVVGLTAGKRVISSVPPGGKPCVLPHPEIEKLARAVSSVPPVKA
jgi:hypothetical protein